jgi:hypothetical protein
MYLRGAETRLDKETEEEMYDLFGVVEHIGKKMDGGHYIAYIRGKNSLGEDSWWKCNDASCWIVSPEAVASSQGYIWFYERRSERGRVPREWGDRAPEQPDEEQSEGVEGLIGMEVGLSQGTNRVDGTDSTATTVE